MIQWSRSGSYSQPDDPLLIGLLPVLLIGCPLLSSDWPMLLGVRIQERDIWLLSKATSNPSYRLGSLNGYMYGQARQCRDIRLAYVFRPFIVVRSSEKTRIGKAWRGSRRGGRGRGGTGRIGRRGGWNQSRRRSVFKALHKAFLLSCVTALMCLTIHISIEWSKSVTWITCSFW